MGSWQCYRVDGGKRIFLGEVDGGPDIMGDDLYFHMEEADWIKSIDDYDVDGDSAHVAVMGKTAEAGDFSWEYTSDGDEDLSEEDMTPEIAAANDEAIRRKRLEKEGRVVFAEMDRVEGENWSDIWRFGPNRYVRDMMSYPEYQFGYEWEIGEDTYEDEYGNEWRRVYLKVEGEWR